MSTRVERDWNFNPETGMITVTREHPTESRGSSVFGHMVALKFEINNKTKFDGGV